MPFLLALLALAGFGTPDPPAFNAPRQVPDPVTAPVPLHLRVELPDEAPTGMTVPYRVVLANRGDVAMQVELGGRPIAFDVVVRSENGGVLWRRLEGVAVEAILIIRTLAPGEVVVFEGRWDQRDNRGLQATPGSYQVRAVLPVAEVPGGWGSESRKLVIVP